MIGYEIVNSVSGLFPEEQKRLNITKEEVRQTVLHSVTRARDYLCEIDPAIRTDRLDVKFSIIIEKPSDEVHLPISVLIQPMTKCRSPPIICDVYNVVRQNALVKDSSWVRQREAYYERSGPSVEEILLCENNEIFEGGQSNFFMVRGDKMYTRGDGVLQGTVRSMVINLCEKLGIALLMEAPPLSEIATWDACFLTSTSRFIMNIDRVRKDGVVLKEFSGQNEIVKRIQNAITEELKVESEEAFLNWSVCVKQEKLIIGCVRIT